MNESEYCQCKNSVTASPCIVCGKPKFIDPEWLRRKIEEDGEEGEIGAGFELFPLLAMLWCVNIQGPDDIVATASYIDAVRLANAFNGWWQELRTQKPLHEQFDARMWAVPIEWPHDAASHTDAVANPSTEYAGFISKATTP